MFRRSNLFYFIGSFINNAIHNPFFLSSGKSQFIFDDKLSLSVGRVAENWIIEINLTNKSFRFSKER